MARKNRKGRNEAAVFDATEQTVIETAASEQPVIAPEASKPADSEADAAEQSVLVVEAREQVETDAPAAEQPVIETPPAKRRGRPRKHAVDEGATPAENGAHGPTLGDVCEAWLKYLEEAGKSRGTVFGYSIDVAIALKHFGAETAAVTLTARKVQNYFDSEAVTLTRAGRAKAKPTIDKTRRAFRLALTWAAEAGLIASAPIPEPQS